MGPAEPCTAFCGLQSLSAGLRSRRRVMRLSDTRALYDLRTVFRRTPRLLKLTMHPFLADPPLQRSRNSYGK